MNAKERKERPVYSGVLKYFPKALLEIARVSYLGHEQHNPGTPMRWDRSKSPDEADALVRHLLQAGEFDSDGLRHTAKAAWRALALLEKELEAVHDSGRVHNGVNVRDLEAFSKNKRPSHDERWTQAKPCRRCKTETYPGPDCVACQRTPPPRSKPRG